ncbi:hypothetical protein [Alicyclobacillus sp. ALC3]|uniref:hypothetical protein n=1 Tax=Alicyclobacillus sp. ALC3 TaxID=2796143 RepID=UPI002379778B|nr:hypothetical protein [Alicyclobacillus sp. ALC3]WDL95938.1 hypothetical protein JC200_16490 [Alicyclobacillus sp. ALC3]
MEVQLYVSDGHIPCPNRGNINLDICLFCEHLTEVELDAANPFIRCTPPTVSAIAKTEPEPLRYRPKKSAHAKTLGNCEMQVLNELVSDISRLHPEWGVRRIKKSLESENVYASTRKISLVMEREGLLFQRNRMNRLMSLAMTEQVELTEHQVEVLELHDACFRERGLTGSYPGQHVIQASLQVDRERVGRPIMSQVVIDTYSGYTFANVHCDKPVLHAISVLQHYVLPFFKERHLRTEEITTAQIHPCKSGSDHSYTEYLCDLGIRHNSLEHEPALVQRFVQEFWKPWSRQLRVTDQGELRNLQSQLVKSLRRFNESASLPGFPNLGQSPRQRIDNYLDHRESCRLSR